MICLNCCRELPDDATVCDGCGKKVHSNEIQNNSGSSYRQFIQLPNAKLNDTYTRKHIKSYSSKHIVLKRIGIILAIVLAAFLIIVSALFFLMQYTNIKLLNLDNINVFAQKSQKEFTLGSYEGNRYTNNFFGISFALPDNWTIASKEELAEINKEIDYDNLEKEKYLYFTYARKYDSEKEREFNSGFMFGSEKKPLLFAPDADGYLESAKKLFNPNIDYQYENIVKQTIGGIEFSVLKASANDISQDFYVAKRNGYYIFFITTYDPDIDKAILDNILTSVAFQ